MNDDQDRGGTGSSPIGLGWGRTPDDRLDAPAGTGGGHRPAPDTADYPPPVAPSSRFVEGYVAGFTKDSEEDFDRRSVKVWGFRVDRYDEQGNRVQSIPVVMRGLGFRGSLHDGDRVRVPGPWRPGRDLRATRVYNLTTHSWVEAQGYGRIWLLAIVSLVVFFALVLGVFQLVNAWGNGWRPPWMEAAASTVAATQAPVTPPPSIAAVTLPPTSGPVAPTAAPEPVAATCDPDGGTGVDLIVPAGGQARWTNVDTLLVKLGFTAGGPQPAGEGFYIEPGASQVVTFAQPGSYPYGCVFADGSEQTGTVSVP